MTTAPALPKAVPVALRRGGPLTGVGALTKLALRRDSFMLPIWLYVVIIGVASNAFAFARLYKTASLRCPRSSRPGTATRR